MISRWCVLLLAYVAAPTAIAKSQGTAQERLVRIWGWETPAKADHRALKRQAFAIQAFDRPTSVRARAA